MENQEEQAVWENRVVSVNPVAPVVVAVHQVPSPPVVRAAAERIALAVIAHPAAEAVARSAAGVEISPEPVAAGAAIAWVAAVSAAAVAAAEAVAVADVVAAEAVAVAVADAGDEQFSNGIKTYEIENKHHEAIKNFFARLCDHYVRCGGVFNAGRAGN